MKPLIALAAALALAGCTIQIGAKATAGRVIISAGTPAHHTVTHSLAHTASATVSRSQVHSSKHHNRAVASRLVRSRDLSAANDITSMTYTLVNTNTNAVVDSKPIDPGFPYVDLFLTPGGNYRIIIDVGISSSAPGSKQGVTRYGDQADFTVDLNYDTYVDLSVHPTEALIFDPASVTTASTSNVKVYDPTSAATMALPTSWSMTSGFAFTAGPSDKFFYGPDAALYYFNKAKNAVYLWKDIGTSTAPNRMTSTDKYIDGTDLGAAAGAGGDIAIYAVCADPWDASSLWLLGTDPSGQWNYYAVTVNQTTPSNDSVWDTVFGGIDNAFLDSGITDISDLSVVTPTDIAVDSTWGDVYITYYTKSSGSAAVPNTVFSGVVQFYGDSLFAYVSGQVDTSTQPIITDVTWDQGKAWVLGSPTTSLTGANIAANTGIAFLETFDDYLAPLSSYPVLQKAYSGSVPSTAGASQLVLPNRFTGPIQTTTLYISQADFADGSNHALSAVNLSNNTVASY